MTHPRSLTVLLLAIVLLAACAQPTPTPPPVSPTVPASTATAPPPTSVPVTEPTTTPSATEPIYLSIIWHQHQPIYYKDPVTGIYVKPWVRLHATKDYVDMAATLAKYPDVKATFNLTPSLIRQLDDLAAGARDLYQVKAEIPADQLTVEDKRFLLQRFFDINPKIIERFPRYQELAAQRGDDFSDAGLDATAAQWTEQDFRDLQVLFNLAWTDPDWLAEEPLSDLVDQGRDFTEEDKTVLFAGHLRLVQQVVAIHKQLQDAGQIEVTMTPYAHPILPLLIDTNLARDAIPDIKLPQNTFRYGGDARDQVNRGVEFYTEHFGQAPKGMWPAEGAVAQVMVNMVAAPGIQWMASDEEVLARSLGLSGFTRNSDETVNEAAQLYTPYIVSGSDSQVAMVFRDKTISDKVGFTYSGVPGKAAAADFVQRIHNIRDQLQASGEEGPHLVSVILDGENAWEHYPNDGKEFLETLYELLANDPTIKTVTPSVYLAQFPDQPPIETLWSGSWVTPDYTTWIGEDEENLAWDYLARTRQTLDKYLKGVRTVEPDKLEKAKDLMMAAEGSDWFWWYGADQNSGDDGSFDAQFRQTLKDIYLTLGEEVPLWVDVPVIPLEGQAPEVGASSIMTSTVDGQVAADEWAPGGSLTVAGGAMAQGNVPVDRLYYGFDGRNLYLGATARSTWQADDVLGFYLGGNTDQGASPFSHYGAGQTILGFNSPLMIEVAPAGPEPAAQLYTANAEGAWTPATPITAAFSSQALEMVIPFSALGKTPDAGDQIKLRTVVSQGQPGPANDVAALPAAGPALLIVPDLGLSTALLTIDDPAGDDTGPGTYTYPTDAVFGQGAYDIKTFSVAGDENNIIFRFDFNGPLNNSWGAPNGMGIHTVDVYVDTDGVEGSGARQLFPGRNAAVPAGDAWDIGVWAEGWTPGLYRGGADGVPEKIDTPFTIISDPAQQRITIRVPKSVFGDNPDPTAWKVLGVVAGQEGFPATGVWRIRDVNANSEQWRFGGAPADTNHTRIIDVAYADGFGPGQATALGTYPASQETKVDNLTADDFAQLPLVPVAP
jgi:alpha-amylase/alpha-mannosidase (GH57 family)